MSENCQWRSADAAIWKLSRYEWKFKLLGYPTSNQTTKSSLAAFFFALNEIIRKILLLVRWYHTLAPPPQDLLFASFCLPKVLPESFLHSLKEKQTKNQETTKKNKKKQNPEGTLRKLWLGHFPQGFVFLFFFGLFGLRLLRAYS